MSHTSPLTFRELSQLKPGLCAPKTWIEDDQFLSQIGITIPGKNQFPLGYVKHLPQDFVVEEIDEDGRVHTVNPLEETHMEDGEYGGTYYATLVKCNMTTFDAVRQLAAQLDCSETQIQHAGI